MASLLEIAAVPVSVPVGGGTIDVCGLSAKGIASLMTRFPMLKDMILGAGVSLGPDEIAGAGPDAVAAIIAAGCGFPGNAAAEEKAAAIPFGIQIEILGAILTATLPGGAKKVFDRLADAASAVGLSQTSSQPQSPTSSQEGT